MVTLYAWANPAFSHGSPVDHTWVTTYDNRGKTYASIGDVISHGEDYWYCWGSFHARGSTKSRPDGSLGSMAGDRELAQCICVPNVAWARIHWPVGRSSLMELTALHQLANQSEL
jgi:hypothetical protein